MKPEDSRYQWLTKPDGEFAQAEIQNWKAMSDSERGEFNNNFGLYFNWAAAKKHKQVSICGKGA